MLTTNKDNQVDLSYYDSLISKTRDTLTRYRNEFTVKPAHTTSSSFQKSHSRPKPQKSHFHLSSLTSYDNMTTSTIPNQSIQNISQEKYYKALYESMKADLISSNEKFKYMHKKYNELLEQNNRTTNELENQALEKEKILNRLNETMMQVKSITDILSQIKFQRNDIITLCNDLKEDYQRNFDEINQKLAMYDNEVLTYNEAAENENEILRMELHKVMKENLKIKFDLFNSKGKDEEYNKNIDTFGEKEKELKKELARLKTEIEKLKSENEAKDFSISDLKANINQKATEIVELKNENRKLAEISSQVSKKEASTNDLKRTVDRLSADLTQKKEIIEEQNKLISKMQFRTNEASSMIQTENEKLKSDITFLKNQIDELKIKNTQLETEKKLITESYKNSDKQLKKIMNDMEQCNTDIKSREERFNELFLENQELKIYKENSSKDLKSLQEKISEEKTRYEKALSEMTEKEKDSSKLKEDNLNKAIFNHIKTIEDQKKAIEGLKIKISELETNNFNIAHDNNNEKLSLKREIDSYKVKCDSLVEETKSLKDDLSVFKQEKQDLVSKVLELTTQLNEVKEKDQEKGNGIKRISSSQNPKDSAKESNKLKKENNTLKNRNELLSKEVTSLQNEIIELKKQNDDIQILQNENETLKEINNNLTQKLCGDDLAFSSSLAMNDKKVKEQLEEKDAKITELQRQIEVWEKEYYDYLNQIQTLQKYIDKMNTEKGIKDQIESMKTMLKEKSDENEMLKNVINQYKTQCDSIINNQGLSANDKELIKILINDAKASRQRVNDILSFHNRITNFDEFAAVCDDVIKKNSPESKEKLKSLLAQYTKNNTKKQNEIIAQLYK